MFFATVNYKTSIISFCEAIDRLSACSLITDH